MEGGIFGGGADQGQETAFDMGQEAILLGLVEAVDLIDKEQCLAAVLVAIFLKKLRRFAA